LRRWYDAWNAHDVEAISALMTDDVSYEDPSAPADVLHGRSAVEEYVRAAFACIPDLRLEKLEEWVTPGGSVISSYFRFSGTFRGPLAGARVAAPGADGWTPRGLWDGSQRDQGGAACATSWWNSVANSVLSHREAAERSG